MSTLLSGNLANLKITDVVQNTCLKARGCQFIVKNSAGKGSIFFCDGEPIHAQMGKLVGNEAIYSLLTSVKKDGGTFYIDFNSDMPEEKTVSVSWEQLIKQSRDNPEPRTANLRIASGRLNIVAKREEQTISRGEKIIDILKKLRRNSIDIEGAALVSNEGLVIASAMPEELEEEQVAAISAIVLSLGERIVNELARGELEEVYAKGKNGYVLITHCGLDALLVIVTNQFAKLGMIFLDAKRAIKELQNLLIPE